MKFAQSSFVYCNYSLPYAIRSLGRLGYDGISVWGGRPHMYRQDLHAQLSELRDLLAEYNMAVCHVIPAQFRYPSLLSSSNEKVRRDSVRYIMDNVDNALLLGAPSVHVCAGFSLFDESPLIGWERLRRSICEILEYMRGTNLRLYIEPAHRFESNQILSLDDGLRMLDEICDPRLGLLLDTGHLHVNGEDLAAGVQKLGPVLGHVDLDDNDGSADAHLAPGQGTLDFGPFAAALRASSYAGYISVELGMAYVMDPEPVVARCLQWLRQTFPGGDMP
jgi:fructoselysine 3-epimerase